MKNLKIAALAFGLMVPLAAFGQDGTDLAKGVDKAENAKPATARSAQPAGPQAWPEALKHRNARYAVLDRSFDATGDDHEAFVLNYELVRLIDRLGDYEVRRIYRQYGKGLKRVIHARIERAGDPMGDRYQKHLAKLPLSRRFADFRRTRDLTGDKVELAQWKVDRLRHGDLGPKRIGIRPERVHHATQDRDEHFIKFRERSQDKRQSVKQDTNTTRAERKDEREFEAAEQRQQRLQDRKDEQAMDEMEDELDDEERELEREEDDEIDKTLESAEEGGAEE